MINHASERYTGNSALSTSMKTDKLCVIYML